LKGSLVRSGLPTTRQQLVNERIALETKIVETKIVETKIVEMKIIEMRTYKLKPGKRSEFLEIFRSKSIPAHAEIGMKILGPFLSIEDPDTFFFMRGFPDLASRDPMKAKFYEGELWKRELENLLMPMIEKYDVVLVEDPEGLVRW
jgi:hypothetical protein